MTQRSWSVPFFDFIDITQFSRENPLRGFDRKLDAYVSFNYNFTYVFDLLDGFAQVANDTINTTILDPVNQGMDEFNKKANELTQPFQDFGAQNIDLNLNVPITIPTG